MVDVKCQVHANSDAHQEEEELIELLLVDKLKSSKGLSLHMVDTLDADPNFLVSMEPTISNVHKMFWISFDPDLQHRIHATSLALSTSGATPPLALRVDIVYGWNQAEGSSDLLWPKLDIAMQGRRASEISKYRFAIFRFQTTATDKKGILLLGSLYITSTQGLDIPIYHVS